MKYISGRYQKNTKQWAGIGLKRLSIVVFFLASYGISVQAKELKSAVDIDIKSQQTDKALLQLAESTGIQIIFTDGVGENTRSPAVRKGVSIEEALTQILKGTDLSYEYTSDDMLIIEEKNKKNRSNQEGSALDNSSKVIGLQLAEVQEIEDKQSKSKRAGQTRVAANSATRTEYEEVTVTAQLREQNLQEVPLAISAFSADFLEDTSISGVGEIAKFTPGFTASNFSAAEPIFAIRGANNTFNAAAYNKPVAVFLDDVFISRNSGAAFDLFDLEQVTVLRGPQGTLAGRNVTGGVINVRTAKPSLEEFTSKVEVGYGDYDFIETRGLVNGPVGENVALKASVSYKDRDGFGHDRFTGVDTDDLDSLNFRGQALFVPTDNLEVLLTLSYGRDENGNRTLSNQSGNPLIDDGDIRTSEVGDVRGPSLFEREVFSTSLHVDWDVGPGTIKSITSYSKADIRNVFGRVGANFDSLTVAFDDISDDSEKPDTFSQEFRFVSEDTEKYNYVVGTYYFHEDNSRTLLNLRRTGTAGFPAFGTPFFRDNIIEQEVETHSIAVYSDIQLHITDYMDINFGGRYTYDNKKAKEDFSNVAPIGGGAFTAGAQRSWNNFTPRAVVTFYPTDDMTVFFNYSEGFTAGGINTEALNAASFNTFVDPEKIRNIEVGIKAQWFDRLLTTNITGFISKYTDKQEFVFVNFPPFVGSVQNAGKATVRGIEAEFAWSPTESLNINATYAYLEATYDEFLASATVFAGPQQDFSGNDLASSPAHSASVYADYVYGLGGAGDIKLNGSYAWSDNYYNGAANKQIESVEAVGLLNASLAYITPDEKGRITLWAKNLTDEDVKLFGSDFNIAIGGAAAYGPPRTYGVRLTYQF